MRAWRPTTDRRVIEVMKAQEFIEALRKGGLSSESVEGIIEILDAAQSRKSLSDDAKREIMSILAA
jgi:hypothetical protein